MSKKIATVIGMIATLCLVVGCASKDATGVQAPTSANGDKTQETGQATEVIADGEPVVLTICGPWAASKGIESAAVNFHEKYPNVDIQYEYVQNYTELLPTRLENSPETVDLFFTDNVREDSPFYPYAEELTAHSELDLSTANPALIRNAGANTANEQGEPFLYSIPLGGELRGLYVNETLLSSVGLEIPTNREELLNCCEVLLQAGYIPMNGNPGVFGQRLLYPYICNSIANASDYQDKYDKINAREDGIADYFEDAFSFMYLLTEKGYYNYKYVETELNQFTDMSDEAVARDFFSIVEKEDAFEKKDDLGNIAFMVGTMTQNETMEQMKEDYHSDISYQFILAPVTDQGGYAYVSPGKGLGVNKNGAHVDAAVAFLNYLLEPEANKLYASESNTIPNTSDSFDYIKDQFDIPADQMTDVGTMTFDYNFYGIINDVLVDTSKGNNPKYMDTDASGNAVMYPFSHYMDELKAAFAGQEEDEQ